MVQFECHRDTHPLLSFNFGVHCGLSFFLDAGKWKCCIWTANNMEIYFTKIGFLDCKWSNLNAPGSHTPWCHSFLGSTEGCPLLCMQEKGLLHVACEKVEIYSSKIGFVDSKWSNLNTPGSYTPWCPLYVALFSGCRKREVLHVASQ